jgi:pimeloyl-ACP methyl ester carboxylesterase
MLFQTVPTQFITVNDIKLGYRRLGKQGNIPLVFLTHFRGSMDLMDPLLANSIAQNRELILFDNTGCGHSGGVIPDTIQEAGSIAVAFLAAIDVHKADILGFSMGGLVAQSIAVDHPELINKLILSGTQSGYAEGSSSAPRSVFELAGGPSPSEEDMMELFFYPSETSRALGHAWWRRTQERNVAGEQPKYFVEQAGGQRQQSAITKFVSDFSFFPKLKDVEIPILITNGKNDIMTPTPNSYLMQQHLRNAELHLYPDSGHGHLYQEPEAYAKQLELFLER